METKFGRASTEEAHNETELFSGNVSVTEYLGCLSNMIKHNWQKHVVVSKILTLDMYVIHHS